MGLLGIVWIVLIILKLVGVIHAGWLILIFWPLVPVIFFAILAAVFGVGVAGFSALKR